MQATKRCMVMELHVPPEAMERVQRTISDLNNSGGLARVMKE